MTWSGLSSVRLTSRCPDWHLTGPANPWETSLSNFGPLRASQGMTRPVSGQLGHLRAIPVLWGPLQVNMNMNLCISEPHFVLQISQPRIIPQKWFCTQNLHMGFSFQNKKNGLKIRILVPEILNKYKRSIFFETPCTKWVIHNLFTTFFYNFFTSFDFYWIT